MTIVFLYVWAIASLAITAGLVHVDAKTRKTQRRIRQLTELTIRDEALARWARETTLEVFCKSGYVYTKTLADMHADGLGERFWTDPIAVALREPDTTHRHG